MATTKKRINISMERDMETMLSRIARRDRMPEATKAAELLHVALEIEEDRAWAALADKRDKEGARFASHKKAWA